MTPSALRSMDDIAQLMRTNLPAGTTLATFGAALMWGRGNDDALIRISTLKREELERIGLSKAQAEAWAVAYEAIQRIAPDNPSAEGRAQLMRHAVKLLEVD